MSNIGRHYVSSRWDVTFNPLCTYQCFAPPTPMRENEGLNQGIILKFCPQGRGVSLANTKLLSYLIVLSLSKVDIAITLPLMQ